MTFVPKEIVDLGPAAVAMYERLSSEHGPRWAEMCVLQQPPGLRGTDRALMQGRFDQSWLDSLPKDQARKILREAKAAGISTSGKFYCSGLADSRMHEDPAAWIDSVSDIKKVAAERNLTIHGCVETKGVQMEPKDTPRLNDRIAKRLIKEERHKYPGKSDNELREIVTDKYAPKWKKRNK
jgi:hypothetical protein